MALNVEGWLNGSTALIVLLFDVIVGSYCIYKARKIDAKLLKITGLTIFFTGTLWMGPSSDFLVILFTQSNIEPFWLYGMLSYMWAAPAIFFAMYLGAELLIPKKKMIFIITYLVLGILYEIFLFTNLEGSFYYTFPETPGENLIDTSNRIGPTFILIGIFLLSTLIFNGLGFLNKALQATGVIRKKFLSLSIGFIIFSITTVFDALIPPGLLLPIVRIGIIISGILLFWGIKT